MVSFRLDIGGIPADPQRSGATAGHQGSVAGAGHVHAAAAVGDDPAVAARRRLLRLGAYLLVSSPCSVRPLYTVPPLLSPLPDVQVFRSFLVRSPSLDPG